ncbi:MAG TPA: sigma-70 family RNA polymerase sigma factor [Solirubrobacteraceae bacterium]|nr:sigma-70 family RNA polymerase sigma factor [Solirubrobacteraceae bacterium]
MALSPCPVLSRSIVLEVMELETLIQTERGTLVSRLSMLLGGDHHAAEDLAQEAFARAWRGLPVGLDRGQQRAWLHRTSRNLAVDELRRRRRRLMAPIEHLEHLHASAEEAGVPDAAREALGRLSAHERFVLLLRFEAGFTHAEIAQLLDGTEEAARKRVSRARAAFLDAYRVVRAEAAPLVLLVVRDEHPAPYVRWLEQAGARVRQTREAPTERQLSLADGLVVTGAVRDIHAGLYGETPVLARGELNLERDRIDMAVVSAAIAMGLPFVGVCGGHQLLNIAAGGSLYQDVIRDGVAGVDHDTARHVIETQADGSLRRIVGPSLVVRSEHHQAIRRLGRRLRVVATSPDGLIETIERDDRRFALGLQWHPELDPGGRGDLVAAAFVESMQARAA